MHNVIRSDTYKTPVAFCPAVHFLGGIFILFGVCFCLWRFVPRHSSVHPKPPAGSRGTGFRGKRPL